MFCKHGALLRGCDEIRPVQGFALAHDSVGGYGECTGLIYHTLLAIDSAGRIDEASPHL